MILWQGPSAHNGVPIVAIATFDSANPKTGPMIQCWILAQRAEPTQVMQSPLLEAGICGSCPLRASGPKRGCYVVVHHAPQNVWRTWKAGRYQVVSWPAFDAYASLHGVRIGAYGDPGTVPISVWERAIKHASKHTGYTHMWERLAQGKDGERWAKIVMASTDSAQQVDAAAKLGWSTYSIKARDEQPRGIQCPENQSPITCQRCGMCDGNKNKQRHIWTERIS